MSYFTQFFGGGNAGSVPLGGYQVFSSNQPNQITLSDGQVYLKSGVLAKASDFPTVPSSFCGYLNPLVPVSEIGSGGCWTSIVMDSGTGLPIILSNDGYGGLVMMRSLNTDRSEDVTLRDGNATSGGALKGGSYPGILYYKAIMHKGVLVVNQDASLSGGYTDNVWSSVPPFYDGTAVSNATAGQSHCFASNPIGNLIALGGGTGTTAWYASTATTAATATTLPASATWTAATYNAVNGMFIAVASGGTHAASSPTGVTWTSQTLPASASWSAVAAGTGARTVAVASGGVQAAYSDTGTTWTLSSLPVSANWSAVAHNGLLWCAVARDSNIAATSSDGITWTQQTLPTTAGWTDVQWCATLGVWVTVADDGRAAAAYSTDGVTWTAKQLPFLLIGGFSQIMSGGGSVLYATEDLQNYGTVFTVAKSVDAGITWKYYKPTVTLGLTSSFSRAIHFVNGALVVMWPTGTGALGIGRSLDGISWVVTTATTPVAISGDIDFAWNGTNYVVVFNSILGTGEHTSCITSPNLVTWTQRTFAGSMTCKWWNVISAGTVFLALGAATPSGTTNTTYPFAYFISKSSDNGVTWSNVDFDYNSGSNIRGISPSTAFLQYNSSRNVVCLVRFDSYAKISYDLGSTWRYGKLLYDLPHVAAGLTAGGGGTWAAATKTSVVVFDSQYGSAISAPKYNYQHGYTLKWNLGIPIASGYSPTTTSFNVVIGGTSYYLDGQYLLKLEPSSYIDNTQNGIVTTFVNGGINYYSQVTATPLTYYMRVK